MSATKLKRPLAALAVTAGLLAVAGPASAATSDQPSLKGDGNDVTIETAKIVYNGHAGLGSASLEIITDLPPVTAKVHQARSAVLPELDANANAFLPEVNDEVLALVNFEPDLIEGTQFVELKGKSGWSG